MKPALILAASLLPLHVAVADGHMEDTGAYGGGAMMLTQVEDDNAGLSYDDSAFGWKLFGGYQFNPRVAVEGGYANLGKAEDDILGLNVEAEFSGFTASVVGMLPAGNRFSVIGKAGLYSGETEVTVDGISADDDDSGLTLGAGARYTFSDQVLFRSDFDWYDVDLDSLWSLSVGVNYRFR